MKLTDFGHPVLKWWTHGINVCANSTSLWYCTQPWSQIYQI